MYLGTYYGVFELSAPLFGEDIELWPVQYVLAGQEEDNWEDCSEEGDDDDEMVSTPRAPGVENDEQLENFSDDDESDSDEGFMDPEQQYGPPPVELTPIAPLTDFFDNRHNITYETTDELLAYMEKKYNFFLPHFEYIKDVDKLLAYICEKIGVGLTCIYSNKGFYSLEAVQQHMRDKHGQRRINMSGEYAFEYADFYDFDKKEENEINIENFMVEDMQLILPSGVKLGHKDMAKYYKQKFDFIPAGMEFSEYGLNRQKMLKNGSVQSAGRKLMIDSLLARVGSINNSSLAVYQKGAAIKQMARDVRVVHDLRKKRYMNLGIKHNKVKQTHFKKQMMNCG